jgi:hypothetical protein
MEQREKNDCRWVVFELRKIDEDANNWSKSVKGIMALRI